MRMAAEAIDWFFAAHMFPRERASAAADVAALERYATQVQRPPEEFYALPSALRPGRPAFGDMGRLGRVRFRSPVVTPSPENNTLHVRVRRCGADRRSPSVVVLHGWCESGLLFSRLMQWGFARSQMHALLMELPFNCHRTPRGEANGALMLTGDLVRTIRALQQAVLDVRLLVEWIRAGSAGPVGLFGSSLGGLVAGLAAVATDSLDFVILNTPAVDLVASLMEEGVWRAHWGEVVRPWRGHAELVREVLRIVTPKCYPLRLPRERVLLIEARYDTFVPARQTEALWEAWGRPPRVRYDSGHITNFALNGGRIRRVACGFIRGLA